VKVEQCSCGERSLRNDKGDLAEDGPCPDGEVVERSDWRPDNEQRASLKGTLLPTGQFGRRLLTLLMTHRYNSTR